jgi:hypothetical protein
LVCALGFALLNACEELAAFGAAILDKGFDILLKAGDGILHLGVEVLGP